MGTTLGEAVSLPLRKNRLKLMPLAALRPTQMAVGMRAVEMQKRKVESRSRKPRRFDAALAERPIPIVRGPDGDLFIIDRHHFALALWKAQIEEAYTHLIEDISELSPAAFWRRMEAKGWLHPYDEDGRRAPAKNLPRRLEGLRHDPYRDLAWEVREAGGFQKTPIPFAEFRWSAFFRERITAATLRRSRPAALNKALKLCRTDAASGLPGFIGRSH